MGSVQIFSDALERIYFDPAHEASFGGVEKLYLAAKPEGVTRQQVVEWLKGKDSYTLHKRVFRKFKRNKVLVSNIAEQYQADLNDMRSLVKYNDGYNYILTVIDCFSRKAWALPLKTKTGLGMIEAFKIVFQDTCPLKLQTDKGTEFKNRQFQAYLKEKGVKFFTTENDDIKACMVERLNQSLKGRMYKYFTQYNTKRYVDVLDDLVQAYNNSIHSTIKMAPSEVSKTNVLVVFNNIYGKYFKEKRMALDKNLGLKVGAYVRVSRNKMVFEKGYERNFTIEVFKIVGRVERHPPVFKLEDLDGQPIKGVFYSKELQSVDRPLTYKIEKVLRKRTRNGQKEIFVKWLGYPESMSSWIPAQDAVSLLLNAP